jgi:carbamoyl-phosphate synthase small subunit
MKLVLSDGSTFEGTSFGADRDVSGEVVFNTGMTGYTEALTDPSYRGQILVLTYPLEGNYGIPAEGWESTRIQIEGLVIGHLAARPSHPRMRHTLGGWLRKFDVPAITNVDTRAVTKVLRAAGTMPGAILRTGSSTRPTGTEMRKVAELVTEPGIRRYDGGRRRVLLLDTGAKESIVRSLQQRDLSVVRVPFYEPWEALLAEVDALMLPNGPGDPTDLADLVARVRPVLGDKPVLGICLGHQLVSLAAGARTYKLPYGHRSQNQPVIDVATKRTYITTQNHGYAVDAKSIPSGFVESYRNLNDGTNEGIAHSSRPILTVQFHPEAASGPHDTEHVFDRFAKLVFERRAIEAGVAS